MLTPQQVADKYSQKAGASVSDYKAGVQAVTVAPGQLAAAQQQVMVQKWNDSINSGRWANSVSSVSLSSWQQATSTKGANNYPSGVNSGKAKYAAAMAYYLPVAQAVKEGVRAIPRDGGAGSLARVQLAMQAFQTAKANRR